VLKFIRRNAEAAWVKFMFVAIVVVFIFWGMGGIVNGEKAQVVARINDEAIEPVQFQRTYNNLLRVYQDVYKDKISPEMLKTLGLKDHAMDQLIRVSLMRQEAQRLGLRVADSEVRDAIGAMPTFQEGGQFNKDLYLRALRYNNLTPGEFEDAQGEELLVNKLQDLITAGVHVSDAELRDRYNFDNEKVNLRFVKLDAPSLMGEITLTDDDVQAYFKDHQETFREPERVRLEYVLYQPENFAEKAEISDAAVQQYYDDHASAYTQPEQVHARHILFKVDPAATADDKAKVRQRAEAVLAQVKAGGDFAELAKQYSEDSSKDQGGDLGSFSRGKMVKPFEDAAFGLAPGGISDIVESPFGFHIIKVEDKEEVRTRTVDEVKPEIVSALKKEKGRDLAKQQAETDRAKVAAGEALAAVAQANGLSVTTPAPFAQTESLVGIGRVPDFTKAAFAAAPGEVGPVVDTPKGVFVFQLAEKLPSRIPDLAEVRDRVETAARTERAAALAKTKADALLAEVQKGDLDTAAKAVNLQVDETGLFSRQAGPIPKLGIAPDLRKDAFQLTPEKPVAPKVYAVAGASVIAALKEHVPADAEKFNSEKATLLQRIEQERKQQAMESFVNYLKARASIELDEDYLASIPDNGTALDGAPHRQ
jgi:peptidyl-prolyl cis-trans isomerase D